jgi:hypothetical protein
MILLSGGKSSVLYSLGNIDDRIDGLNGHPDVVPTHRGQRSLFRFHNLLSCAHNILQILPFWICSFCKCFYTLLGYY